jgi:hypothetical protein
METSRTPPAARQETLRPRTLALVALGALLAAALAAWAWGRFAAAPEASLRTPEGEASAARQVEVALADVSRAWRRSFPGYVAPEVVFFAGATPTACAGGSAVSGPFYCAETGTIAVDVAFLDALGRRLERQRELGLSLVAARLASEHLQRELGLLEAASLRLVGARRARRAEVAAALALHADCLTGAWASSAGLGAVPEGFWGQLVWSWRNTVSDLAATGVRVPPEFDSMAPASRDERAEAFLRGYLGAAGACPIPEAVAG